MTDRAWVRYGRKPKSEVRQRQGMLVIRVNEDEERRIRAAAKRRGVSVAALLRESALAAAAQPEGDSNA